MQIVHSRCCGLDVHKKSVVACVLITEDDSTVHKAVHTFGTMTADLVALDEWLADLLRHGLLQASFIPPAPIRELRELTRYRKTLVQERTDEINRLQKTLEGANLKLASVASDVLGLSGRAMFAALLEGERDPEVLADLARGKLRAKLPALRRALDGRGKPHHLVLIGQLVAHIDFLEASITQVQQAIEPCLAAFGEAVELLCPIPGVGEVVAAAIVAEVGTDMSRFPSAKQLASWAGVCPGNKQSAGKRLSGKTTRGNPWLRAMLGEAAWSVAAAEGIQMLVHQRRRQGQRGIVDHMPLAA